MKRLTSDHYELSTGRKFSANKGIIGISADDVDGEVSRQLSEGYDGAIDTDSFDIERYPELEWTVEERRELADYMIELWTKWRDGQR